jgi:ATP-dependent RNA helicase RhlE
MGVTFEEFNFNRQILNAIADAGYTEATPIQQKAIPPIMNGQDVMGIAQTGTGKTAAYVLPILMKLKYAQGDNPRALIVSPTRELAMQIEENVKTLPPIPTCGWLYFTVALAQNTDRKD